MKLQDIIDNWKQDCKVDDLNIDQESARIPNLHAKYIEILSNEKTTHRNLLIHKRNLRQQLRRYYLGLMSQEELREFGREQFLERIIKTEIMSVVDADELIDNIDNKLAIQENKLEILTEIMKSINSRGYTLKNIIDWRKLTLGG